MRASCRRLSNTSTTEKHGAASTHVPLLQPTLREGMPSLLPYAEQHAPRRAGVVALVWEVCDSSGQMLSEVPDQGSSACSVAVLGGKDEDVVVGGVSTVVATDANSPRHPIEGHHRTSLSKGGSPILNRSAPSPV